MTRPAPPQPEISTPPAIPPARALALVLAIPTLLLALTASIRFLNGFAGVDLPHFDQGLWLASRGRNPASTVFGEGLLEDHFSPLLLAFTPLYRLLASPIWLIVAQVAAASATVGQIAHRLLPALGWRRAGMVGAALLLSPPVVAALLWDVHAVVFALPFTLAGVYAVAEDRPGRGLLFGLVAAGFRPDAAYAVLAAYVFLPRGVRKRGVPAGALLIYVALATFLEFRLGGRGTGHWAAYYGALGSSPGDALTHPWRVLGQLLSYDSLTKVVPCLIGGAFLALRRPVLMAPALAAGLPTLLSAWGGTDRWFYHYGIAPVLLLAVAWIPVYLEHPGRTRQVFSLALVITILAGPFLPRPPDVVAETAVWRSDGQASCIAEGIPGDATVSSLVRPATFLAHRATLYYWPYPFAGIPVLPTIANPRPELVDGVDYIIRYRADPVPPPPGFVADAATTDLARFRRSGTTGPSPPSCASVPVETGR